jgi:hypothetical protein
MSRSLAPKVQFYAIQGKHLYLTPKYLDGLLHISSRQERPILTFCSMMYYTVCRLSEALPVTPRPVDFSRQVIVFKSLERPTKRLQGCSHTAFAIGYARRGAESKRDSAARYNARIGSAMIALGSHDCLAVIRQLG